MSDRWAAAIQAWRGRFGEEAVWTSPEQIGPYRASVDGRTRRIPCILRPSTTDEVRQMLRIAHDYGLPVYPISCGRNWGMGSRLPIRDETAVADLSRMNRIREINVAGLYAVVEPGVTQGMLCDRIAAEGLPLMVNVTGSGRDTSLIGNALERGVGYFATRADSLYGLEIVLADGRLIHTGFGRFEGARTTYLYRYGLGPSLDGLFAQGNFGIVTAAGFMLMPRPPAHASFIARIASEEALGLLIDRLVSLRRDGVLQTVTHVGNRARTVITLAPLVDRQLKDFGVEDPATRRALAESWIAAEGFGPWSAVGGVGGPPDMVRTARKEIRRALGDIARLVFLTDRLVRSAEQWLHRLRRLPAFRRKLVLLRASAPLYWLTRGIPTDDPLQSVYWPCAESIPDGALDPDQSRCGLLYALPILPADGAAVREAIRTADAVCGRYGLTHYTTINVMDERALEGVFTLSFRRDSAEQTEQAHACLAELEDAFVRQGWPPYRINIHSMGRYTNPSDPFWQVVGDIKRALDPRNIIAPGRYSPF